MISIVDFTKERAAKAGQRYVMPDGTNMAMQRDVPLDILEELSDAYRLSELLLEKLDTQSENLSAYIMALQSDLADMFERMMTMRRYLLCLDENQADLLPIKRHVYLDPKGEYLMTAPELDYDCDLVNTMLQLAEDYDDFSG